MNLTHQINGIELSAEIFIYGYIRVSVIADEQEYGITVFAAADGCLPCKDYEVSITEEQYRTLIQDAVKTLDTFISSDDGFSEGLNCDIQVSFCNGEVKCFTCPETLSVDIFKRIGLTH